MQILKVASSFNLVGFLICDTGAGNSSCCDSCTTVWDGCECNRGAGCTEICGSGYNHGVSGKVCEDGNAAAGHEYYGDGCSWKCTVEAGFTCPAAGSCTEDCGTGTWDFYNYECDDGNLTPGDGCDASCTIETGWYCYNGNTMFRHDYCYEICGDGLDLGMYWCDDGDTESGDGCSSNCHIERGYSCTGGTATNPDTCTEICGDGIDHLWYECDDGNLEDGDGCDSSCTIEVGFRCFGGNYD